MVAPLQDPRKVSRQAPPLANLPPGSTNIPSPQVPRGPPKAILTGIICLFNAMSRNIIIYMLFATSLSRNINIYMLFATSMSRNTIIYMLCATSMSKNNDIYMLFWRFMIHRRSDVVNNHNRSQMDSPAHEKCPAKPDHGRTDGRTNEHLSDFRPASPVNRKWKSTTSRVLFE